MYRKSVMRISAAAFVAVLLVASMMLLGVQLSFNFGAKDAQASASAQSCLTTTSSVATVGDDESGTLLSANGRRAFAIIQQPTNATNTVALSTDEGAAAVLGSGYQLDDIATSTGEASKFIVGLATDMPYTGAITGLTNNGSTTVLVTECTY